MKNAKGMSLLEMLVSLGIFAFMFVFITQVVRQNQRQTLKVKQELDKKSSFDHVIDLIKKDLNSVSFLFDLSHNFRKNFPLRDNNQTLQIRENRSSNVKDLPVFMSPYFVFKGTENEMEFVSYSLTESSLEDSAQKQWIQIRYFIQDCPVKDKSVPCLMRASKKYWNLEKENTEEETLVLFRAFKSLKFYYLTGNDFLNQDWKDSWSLQRALNFPNSPFEYPVELTFPFRVKLEMETEKRKYVWLFNVSDFILNSWNPFSKEFFKFKKWEKPKKQNKQQKNVRAF